MKKALVEPSGRVAQVEPINPAPGSEGIAFPVAAPLVWRDCPDDTTTLHTWNGASFDPPPPTPAPNPSAENAIESARRSRTAKIEDLERRMSLGAPQEDINRSILDLLKE